jgi:hypothetical protein
MIFADGRTMLQRTEFIPKKRSSKRRSQAQRTRNTHTVAATPTTAMSCRAKLLAECSARLQSSVPRMLKALDLLLIDA